MNIALWITAYLVLTAVAIYFAKDEGIFDNELPTITFVRITFLLLIGWLVAICLAVGMIFAAIGFHIGTQTIGYRTRDWDFYLIDWIGGFIERLFRGFLGPFSEKKKEEVINEEQS